MSKAKNVLLFGGSGAIGGAACEALAARGARVAFTYRTREREAIALAERLPGSRALPLEASSVRDIERLVDGVARDLGAVDAFVHCVAVGLKIECGDPKSAWRVPQIDEATYDRMMAVNVKSAFFAIRALLEPMRRAGGGNVVLVGSVDGVKPVPSPVPYAASKAALGGMARSLSKELGTDGIRVNVVAPGVMDGGISSALPPDLLREYLKHCGLKRVGRTAEAGALIAWLALENTYVTGQTVCLDGAL